MRRHVPFSALLVVLMAANTFCQSNDNTIPVLFHGSENWWNWAGTPVKDIFSPYTIETIHIIRSQARSEKEKQGVVKTLLGLIRSDSKFAGGLSLRGIFGSGLEAIVLTKEGKIFIIRRVDGSIYSITSGEQMGHVIFIEEGLKKP